ncbi:hypothetical protein BU16DRAFT_590802 [Lophium mytilinum]|uniref:F-box domain-containing protein n=1 Tax=Lophium mytilinum TaxID=390894 RepID=A0A6A6QQF3_9PEZI|nr:hypothetical protein BU16DRAFT_590802 [Lophium mytilinum]
MATTSTSLVGTIVSESSDHNILGKLMRLNILEHTRQEREKHHAEQAMIAATRNATQSCFYQLPAELILTVADVLTTPSLISLRGTCLKLREIVKQPPMIQADERHEIRHILRRDAYTSYCNSTNENRIGMRKKGCSFCKTTHQLHMFTAAELRNPPSQRLCRGSSGSIKLCKHMNLGLEDLQKLKFNQSFDCRHLDHGFDNDHPRICCGTGHISRTSTWALTSDYNVRICTITRLAPLTRGHLERAFVRMKRLLYFCPHMPVTDCMFKLYEQVDCRFMNGFSHSTPNGLGCRHCGDSVSCEAKGCSTRCVLFRWRNHLTGLDEITLKVTRGFGRGEATDLEWLAQLDPSSSVLTADVSLTRKVLGALGMLALRSRSASSDPWIASRWC